MPRRNASTPVSVELSDSIRRFTQEYDGLSVRTKEGYEYHLGVFEKWATENGLTDLRLLDSQHLRDYMTAQKDYTYCRPRSTDERKLSTETLQSRQQSVSTFLGWCVRQGYITENPAALVRKFKGEKRARLAYSPDEVRKLVSEASKASGWLGYRDRAIVLLLLGTGCRAAELLALTPKHFEWKDPRDTEGRKGDRNLVLLNGKGRKDRRVQLGTNTAEAVREYIRKSTQQRAGIDALFVTYRHEAMVYSALNAMLKNLGKYTGIDEVIPHRFRHTFAITDYKTNKDVMALRNRLGHSDVKVTQNYLQSLGVDYGLEDNYIAPDMVLG